MNTSIRDWALALRLHQWAKNILIFVPIILTHRFSDLNTLLTAVNAFFVFSMVASANYLLNDYIDLNFDRNHLTKKNRPLASGRMSIRQYFIAIIIILLVAMICSIFLPLIFFFAIGLYLIISILYSCVFKRIVIIDVVILAGLYTMRIITGAVVINTYPTFWLLAFSMFIFLSLALVKRYSELDIIKIQSLKRNNQRPVHGRSYEVDDMQVLQSIGSGSGLIAVLVFALYINSTEIKILYEMPEILWLVLPILLYWISRMWLLAVRGLMHQDPVVFALTDKASIASAALIAILLWLATIMA